MAPLTLTQLRRIANGGPYHATQEELWDAGCRAMKAFNRDGPLGTGGSASTAPSSARPAAPPTRTRVRENDDTSQSSAPPAFDDNYVPEPPAWLFD